MKAKKPKTIDAYIEGSPPEARPSLEALRMEIKKLAPEAEEVISYGMPAFRLNGTLVYFAAFSSHIGFYPTASPLPHFRKELARYETSKGAIRFPLGKPLPLALIRRIVKFRLKEKRAGKR
jgi:uncharacterized protein YdhG (YjbR/CyaY superfamily)